MTFPTEDFNGWNGGPGGFLADPLFIAHMETRHVYPNWVHREGSEWWYTWLDGDVYCLSLGTDAEPDLVKLNIREDDDWVEPRLKFASQTEAFEAFRRLPELLMAEEL